MLHLDFNVYDNMETYKKINPIDDKLNHLEVKDVWLKPPFNALWFETTMDREERNVDIHSTYLHLHPGIFLPRDEIQYDDKSLAPILIQKQWLRYDHSVKQIFVKKSLLPWKEAMWRKTVAHYYGSEDPTKIHKIMGKWLFNYHEEELNFILNLYPSRKIDNDEKLRIKSS